MTSLNTDMCSCRKRWSRRYQKITSTPAKVHWSYCGRKSGEALALLRYILPKKWGSRRARALIEFCRVLDGNIMKFTSLSLTFSSLSKYILAASNYSCWFYIDDLSISRLRSRWFSTEVRGQSWVRLEAFSGSAISSVYDDTNHVLQSKAYRWRTT